MRGPKWKGQNLADKGKNLQEEKKNEDLDKLARLSPPILSLSNYLIKYIQSGNFMTSTTSFSWDVIQIGIIPIPKKYYLMW